MSSIGLSQVEAGRPMVLDHQHVSQVEDGDLPQFIQYLLRLDLEAAL
jgi:hypothetical protein